MTKWILLGLGVTVILGIMWWRNQQGAELVASVAAGTAANPPVASNGLPLSPVAASGWSGPPALAGTSGWHTPLPNTLQPPPGTLPLRTPTAAENTATKKIGGFNKLLSSKLLSS